MRFCISILMNAVVALTFLQAPFQHVHEHDDTENHPHGFIHTHLAGRSFANVGKAELCNFDPDDDAQFRDWFSATVDEHSNFSPVFLVAFSYTVAPVWSAELLVERLILSGHDPPKLSRAAPRGPPV